MGRRALVSSALKTVLRRRAGLAGNRPPVHFRTRLFLPQRAKRTIVTWRRGDLNLCPLTSVCDRRQWAQRAPCQGCHCRRHLQRLREWAQWHRGTARWRDLRLLVGRTRLITFPGTPENELSTKGGFLAAVEKTTGDQIKYVVPRGHQRAILLKRTVRKGSPRAVEVGSAGIANHLMLKLKFERRAAQPSPRRLRIHPRWRSTRKDMAGRPRVDITSSGQASVAASVCAPPEALSAR
jgi:hypothetical protein